MKFISRISLFLLAQYILVVAVLMCLYQGGSYFSPNSIHYIFNQNHLSDLGREFYFNGSPNPFWMVYSITLSLVGIGTGLFFTIIAKQLTTSSRYFVSGLGWISGLAYIGIALFPADTGLYAHLLSGKIAYFSFFFAMLLYNISLNRKKYPVIYKWVFVLNVFLFVYLMLMLFAPSSKESMFALQFKTLAQKIMVGMQLLVSVIIIKKIGMISRK